MRGRKIAGRKRRLTDEQVRQIVEWRPRLSLNALARSFGVHPTFAQKIRNGYRYKSPSP